MDEFGSTRRKKQMVSREQAVVSPDAIGVPSSTDAVCDKRGLPQTWVALSQQSTRCGVILYQSGILFAVRVAVWSASGRVMAAAS